jgi:hypothetical protein
VKFSSVAALALLAFSLCLQSSSSTHTLEAKGGHGWIKFWGDGTAEISGRGTLTIWNQSNQQMEVKGTWGEMNPFPDGATYTHFEGSVRTVGLGIHFELRGWDLALSAKGVRGKAWFRGEGTAAVDGGASEPWTAHPDKWLKVKY